MSFYTLCDLLKRHERGNAIALIDGERVVSYAELRSIVERFAGVLREAGIQRGDRIGIFLRRSVDAVTALFAVHHVGGVAVMINDKLKARQVDYILSHSRATLLVTESHLMKMAPGIAVGDRRLIDISKVDGTNVAAREIDAAPIIGQDLALIIYTSGSTGMPKGIMLSHANLLSGAQIIADHLKLSPHDRLISLLPFTFDYGLNQLLSALVVGGTLVIQRSMFPADICRTLLREGVTGMAGVPMLWSQLAQPYSPFTKTQFPDLRYMTNTGGVFPEHLVPVFRQAHPQADLYLMYGLTEAFRSTILPPDQVEARPNSIGKAIPNVEILVVDEQGRECAPDEPGELVHRGANIALGYWRDPEATNRVYRPHPFRSNRTGYSEIVVYSGDIVKRDSEGYLYFVGRKDQMIKSHGVRVSPEEIEYYINASELVSDVVVFAVNRNAAETEIVAAVRPKAPSLFEEAALREYCKCEMPEYMQPAVFWYPDTFPETASSKPDRQTIKETYIAE